MISILFLILTIIMNLEIDKMRTFKNFLTFVSEMKSAEELEKIRNDRITPKDMEGWKKISEDGGSFITARFWNSKLKEVVSLVVRDYDYSDASRDNDYLYNMPIDNQALREYKKFKGIIQEGDTVKVVKGRTLPKGYTGVVQSIYQFKDRFGRTVADYIRFENGDRININNVELLKQ